MENKGGDVGPALDGVGTKYPRDFLVDSILYPSKQILDGYQQTVIKRKSNGNLEQGVLKLENDTEIVIADSGAQRITIKKDDVASRKLSNVSVMPEGLQTALIRFGSNGLVNRWIQASFSCLRTVPNG